LAAKIRQAIPAAEVSLIGGGRGAFTVVADGVQVWNKHECGLFPDEATLVAELAGD